MPKPFITTVTVTGADDGTPIHRLQEIQEEYPFVEFGILLSRKYSMRVGAVRFPSIEWLTHLAKAGAGLNLAGHLCGEWVREALLGNWPDLTHIHTKLPGLLKRWQLNTHAETHSYVPFNLSSAIRFLNTQQQQVIFQYDGVNGKMVKDMQERGCTNISALFDLSHGAGVLPSAWPEQLAEMPCGYAGGLSHENVVQQIEQIEKVCGGRPIWIDAETRLRTDVDFDLNKVEKFLEAAKPYVITP